MPKILEEIEFEDIRDGDYLRIYYDPHNTDLDYVDATVQIAGLVVLVHVVKDYWPLTESSALTMKDGQITEKLGRHYRYFRIEKDA